MISFEEERILNNNRDIIAALELEKRMLRNKYPQDKFLKNNRSIIAGIRAERLDKLRNSPTQERIDQLRFKEKVRNIKDAQNRELYKRGLFNRFSKTTEEAVGSVADFAGTAALGQTFTPEQDALHQMFGGGDKIWGTNQNPVDINHDLNPSQRGDFGTSEIFGFGGRPQRSGLF